MIGTPEPGVGTPGRSVSTLALDNVLQTLGFLTRDIERLTAVIGSDGQFSVHNERVIVATLNALDSILIDANRNVRHCLALYQQSA